MIVCSCPLHDNRNGVDVCNCLCQEHDKFFDQGVALVRVAARDKARQIQAIREDVNLLLSRNTDPDWVRGLADDLNARMAGIERSMSSIWPRLRGVEDGLSSAAKHEHPLLEMSLAARVAAIEERLSPPDKTVEEGNSSWQGPVLREDGTVYQTEVEETAGEMLARLGTDAVKWAEDFIRSVSAHDDDYEVDQVLTWFANAIEAGRSAQVMSDVANADRIRLAKDALMSSGYFDEGQVDDEIAPRIYELIDAHNSGFLKMQDDLNRQINKWKDRAVVAERRMSSVRIFVNDNLRVDDDE